MFRIKIGGFRLILLRFFLHVSSEKQYNNTSDVYFGIIIFNLKIDRLPVISAQKVWYRA